VQVHQLCDKLVLYEVRLVVGWIVVEHMHASLDYRHVLTTDVERCLYALYLHACV
jgi:hypothetical protein